MSSTYERLRVRYSGVVEVRPATSHEIARVIKKVGEDVDDPTYVDKCGDPVSALIMQLQENQEIQRRNRKRKRH